MTSVTGAWPGMFDLGAGGPDVKGDAVEGGGGDAGGRPSGKGRCFPKLKGVKEGWNDGTVVELHPVPGDPLSGYVACSHETIEGFTERPDGERHLYDSLGKFFRVPPSEAEEIYKNRVPKDATSISDSVCLGQTCNHLMQALLRECPKQRCKVTCLVRLLNVGESTLRCARENGTEKELLLMVQNGVPKPYWEIVPLLGNHTFVFARTRFRAVPPPRIIDIGTHRAAGGRVEDLCSFVPKGTPPLAPTRR